VDQRQGVHKQDFSAGGGLPAYARLPKLGQGSANGGKFIWLVFNGIIACAVFNLCPGMHLPPNAEMVF
jgi:hypothetical protein